MHKPSHKEKLEVVVGRLHAAADERIKHPANRVPW